MREVLTIRYPHSYGMRHSRDLSLSVCPSFQT